MKVSELAKTLGFKVFSSGEDRDAGGVYIGDLLSWVMGRAETDDVWLTIMSNLNVSAVAKLADVACVVLCEGVVPDGALLKKAEAEKIWLLGSDKPLYGTALALATHL